MIECYVTFKTNEVDQYVLTRKDTKSLSLGKKDKKIMLAYEQTIFGKIQKK